MAPSGEKLLQTSVTCFSGGIPQRQIRKLDVRKTFHYVHMILIITIVISESKSQMIRILLVCDLC